MKIQHLHNQPGFTLIEVLVAIVVLSIGMLGMSRITVSTVSVHTANERLAGATALLQDSMERIKRLGYRGATTANLTPENPYGSMSSYNTYDNTTFNYGIYKRKTLIENGPAANMKTVTVRVYWQKDKQELWARTILAE